ncbi:MAG: vWA domain-containing protein [Phascolarctobacterium sp.]|nr:vWA domain-containing protein [Phascolarctobacterium sp.]
MKKALSVVLLCCISACAWASEPGLKDSARASDKVRKEITVSPKDKCVHYPDKLAGDIVVKTEKDVEIVFVLDTTGSMGGLIQGAKDKIWTIVNDVMQHQRTGSKVRIGLVAYRDRGDDYVTKITELSENLDEVYRDLMSFKAQGGGDTPEDVRRALHEGLNNMQWSKESAKLKRIIFLVGDAKPHTDYQDYPSTVETAKRARKQNIIINTIQCGNLAETDKYWREIAQHANGEYFAIAQDGGTKRITTPYDDKLAKLSAKLDAGYVPYGSASMRAAASMRAEETADTIALGAVSEAKAARAYNKAINKHAYSGDDLVQAIENGSVKLSDVKEEDLPDKLQKMSADQRETYVSEQIASRKAVREEISKIYKEREAYISAHAEENADGFDAAVRAALLRQIK